MRLGMLLLTLALAAPAMVRAQHGGHGEREPERVEPHGGHGEAAPQAPATDHAGHGAPLGLAHNRSASGTAWAPDSTPIDAWHVPLGDWTLAVHGNLFAGVSAQGSERGETEALSVNWAMAMLAGPVLGGELGLRLMLSAEPWTVANGGYPLLLQTGESFEGEPLRDRQHPHDLFMEVAATYAHELGGGLAASLYVGLPGEPALGPPAYPHRFSAYWNPAAPIGHHWQDATHISFGVITAGVYTRRVRLEGSVFNGREPDDDRVDIELHPLRSFSGRLQLALGDAWAAQVSAGHLDEPEFLHPGEDVNRYAASVLWNRRLERGGNLAAAAVWGANEVERVLTHSVLLEGTWLVQGERHVLLGRAEWVQKSGEELVLPEELHRDVFDVGELTVGYVLEFPGLGGVVPGIGATGTVNVLPAGLERFYGERLPLGAFVFVHLRPPGPR